jgi:hypothetical protein
MARTGHKPDYGKLYTPEEELLARRREPASDDPNGVRYWPADIMRRGPQGWFPDPYQVEIILRLEQGLMPTKREQHIWDEQEEYRRWRLAKPHARFRTPSPDGDDEGQRVGYMSIPIGATPDADENGVTPNMLWMHDESEERIAEVFGQEYARWWFNRQKEITIDSEREWREWRAKQAATAQASGPATVQTPQQTAVQTPEPATIQTIEPAIILTPESTTTQTSGPVPPAKRGKSARQPKKKTQKKKREAQKGKETRRVNKNVQQDDKQNVPEMTTARRLTRQSRARTATTTVFYELDQRGKIRST